VEGFERMEVRAHPYIRQGMKIGLGGMPGEMLSDDVRDKVKKRLGELLQ
jgi:hypothetical protein